MAIYYSKPHLELLLELINEANPGLLEMRDLVNSRFGIPFVRTPGPGEIADTSLEIYTKPGSFYIGKRIVHYRRLNFSKLFANMTVEIDEWAPTSLPKVDWIRLINAKYNLALLVEDMDNAYGALTSTVKENLWASANSLVYSGQLPVRWTRGKRTLEQILPNPTMNGLYWDANYVEGKPLMNLVGMGIDFTRFGGSTKITTGAAINGSSGDLREMADWFSAYTGRTIDDRVSHTLPGGINNLNITRFTLPNANLPEANAAKFNRALVITPKADSWFCGKIIWHYNA